MTLYISANLDFPKKMQEKELDVNAKILEFHSTEPIKEFEMYLEDDGLVWIDVDHNSGVNISFKVPIKEWLQQIVRTLPQVIEYVDRNTPEGLIKRLKENLEKLF